MTKTLNVVGCLKVYEDDLMVWNVNSRNDYVSRKLTNQLLYESNRI